MQPFSAASKQNLRTKANTGEQRYLAPAWPTNAMRDPRRGAATEMSRGEYATAMRETHLGRLLALPHRARSPTAPKRTEAGPCTWSAPPSPSARFLGVISDNTRRGRADDGAEASGLRRRPVGRRALGRHLATPLTGLRACTQPCVACETVKVNSETDRPLWVDHAHAERELLAPARPCQRAGCTRYLASWVRAVYLFQDQTQTHANSARSKLVRGSELYSDLFCPRLVCLLSS